MEINNDALADEVGIPVEHFRKGLESCGYKLVHTWKNSQDIDRIYERPVCKLNAPEVVCVYSYNGGDRIGIRSEQSTGSYLLAEEIKNNPDRYINIDQHISACTSGVVTYYAEYLNIFYTICNTEERGSVAYEVPPNEVTASMKIAANAIDI